MGFRGFGKAVAACLFVAAAAPAGAGAPAGDGVPEVDTEHIFGFTEGADIGGPGETEGETEITGRIGKRGGRYRAVDTAFVLKVPVSLDLRVAPGVVVSRHAITNVPGLADRNATSVGGAFLETRLRLLDRGTSPFGLTLNLVPGVSRNDAATGLRARGRGGEVSLLADREIVPGRLYAALNLSYGLGVSRLEGERASRRDAETELSVALASPVRPGLFLGGELRYQRAYADYGLARPVGQAFAIGPTVYAALTDSLWVSVAWSAQVAGRATAGAGLRDLETFDRHQVRLRVGTHF